MDKGLTTGREAASNEMEDEGKRASSGSWALMHLICGIGSDRDWAKNRTMAEAFISETNPLSELRLLCRT